MSLQDTISKSVSATMVAGGRPIGDAIRGFIDEQGMPSGARMGWQEMPSPGSRGSAVIRGPAAAAMAFIPSSDGGGAKASASAKLCRGAGWEDDSASIMGTGSLGPPAIGGTSIGCGGIASDANDSAPSSQRCTAASQPCPTAVPIVPPTTAGSEPMAARPVPVAARSNLPSPSSPASIAALTGVVTANTAAAGNGICADGREGLPPPEPALSSLQASSAGRAPLVKPDRASDEIAKSADVSAATSSTEAVRTGQIGGPVAPASWQLRPSLPSKPLQLGGVPFACSSRGRLVLEHGRGPWPR
mmetsp:Transcript_10535/g.32789  ORF Transcript_10535/g.32789 Transcript_10535/m.32789 type:complete len:302 (-) Transcript_10535:770-1675(-)